MLETEALPEIVYHYTSMDALLNIVKTRTIWATSIKYLNDVLEHDHFVNAVRARIPDFIQQNSIPANDIFDWVLEAGPAERRPFHDLPFVASFSCEKDSLSQWRSYCPGGNGVCIGFRSACLAKANAGLEKYEQRPWTIGPTVSFGSVSYLRKDDADTIDNKIGVALKYVVDMIDEGEKEDPPAFYDAPQVMWYQLDSEACRVKHESFASEAEYRLLVSGYITLGSLICYRPSKSTLRPYMPVYVPPPDTEPGTPESKVALKPSFIKTVTVGPTPHPDLSIDALNGFFVGGGLAVSVEPSTVPFRDW